MWSYTLRTFFYFKLNLRTNYCCFFHFYLCTFYIRRRQVNPFHHPDFGVVYNWALRNFCCCRSARKSHSFFLKIFGSVQKRNSKQLDSMRVPIYTHRSFSKIPAPFWISCRGSNPTGNFTDQAKRGERA